MRFDSKLRERRGWTPVLVGLTHAGGSVASIVTILFDE